MTQPLRPRVKFTPKSGPWNGHELEFQIRDLPFGVSAAVTYKGQLVGAITIDTVEMPETILEIFNRDRVGILFQLLEFHQTPETMGVEQK